MFSFFLLLVTILSSSRARVPAGAVRADQWELPPLSVRNHEERARSGCAGFVVLRAFVTGIVRANYTSGVLGSLTTAVLALLRGVASSRGAACCSSKRRITRHEVLPAAILVAVVAALLAIAGDIYVPRLFNSYAGRYGAVGAVFALISWLFVLMVGLVAAVAVGREVSEELDSIRRGEKPSNEQIQAEWAQVRSQAHEARQRVADWRAARKEKR